MWGVEGCRVRNIKSCNLSGPPERGVSSNSCLTGVRPGSGRGQTETQHGARADNLQEEKSLIMLSTTATTTHLKSVFIPEPNILCCWIRVNLTLKNDSVTRITSNFFRIILNKAGSV